MNKILLFVCLFSIIKTTQAQKQSSKLFQKVSTGVIMGSFASTDFSRIEKPFSVGNALLVSVNIYTKQTYHVFLYGVGDNSIKSLSGYLLPKNWDVYVRYSKVLHNKDQSLTLGLEKMFTIGDIKSFLFYEVGNNLTGTTSFSFGVLFSLQNTIWKRK